MTFRPGAAAIALSAARRGTRKIVAIPCAIKFWYIDDPTDHLLDLVKRLEDRLLLSPQPERSLVDRIYRLAEAVLALKELDILGETRTGRMQERINYLTNHILTRIEQRYQLHPNGRSTPERVKDLRQRIIGQSDGNGTRNGNHSVGKHAVDNYAEEQQCPERDMEELFLVMQLYSYPGGYLRQDPSIERLAETLDKFEEDILHADLPSVRGRRRVTIRFGPPLDVPGLGSGRQSPAELTAKIQQLVQAELDEINGVAQPVLPAR